MPVCTGLNKRAVDDIYHVFTAVIATVHKGPKNACENSQKKTVSLLEISYYFILKTRKKIHAAAFAFSSTFKFMLSLFLELTNYLIKYKAQTTRLSKENLQVLIGLYRYQRLEKKTTYHK